MERTGQVCVSPATPIFPPPGAGGSEAAAQLAVLAELEQKLWGAVGGALLLVGLISLGCWCCRRKAGNPPHPEQRCAHRPRVRSPHTHPPTPLPGCRPQIPQSPSAPLPQSPPTLLPLGKHPSVRAPRAPLPSSLQTPGCPTGCLWGWRLPCWAVPMGPCLPCTPQCPRCPPDTSNIYVNIVPRRTPRNKSPQGAAAGRQCIQGGLDRVWKPPSPKG